MERLVGAAKQLQQNTLLDVVHFVDRGGQGTSKKFVDIITGGCLPNFLLILDADLSGLFDAVLPTFGILLASNTKRGGVGTHASLVNLLNMQNIDICLVHTLESTLARINTNRTNAEDTRQLDTVTGLTKVYKLVVNTD
ncbi:hypothetical protein HG530_004838 [Fusarium avenaceum]|nr:hypothetical protein HG530_004838 [Fusarium avenaceum]